MNSILIAWNIIKRSFKSRKEIIIMLLLPIMAIAIMTFLTGAPALQKINVGLVNLDKGAYSSKLISQLQKQKSLKLVTLGEKNYQEALKSSKVSAALVIPEGFSSSITNVERIQVAFYGGNSNSALEELKQNINQYISTLYMVSSSASDIASKTGKDVKLVSENLFSKIDKEGLSANFRFGGSEDNSSDNNRLISSIGFCIMFMMVLVFNTMGTIMEDKKKLVLARISTFRVKQWEIAAGNLLGSLALGIIQLIPITLVIGYVYKIKIGLELLGLLLTLICFIIAAIGLSIGLSGIVKENFNPSLIIATVIFPSSLLGGCLIPESMLPSFMSKLGYLVPQKWVMSGIQKVLSGADLQSILLNLGIILMFGLAFTTFGVKTIKPLDE